MSVSLSSRIKFKQLCEILERIIKVNASEKIKILREFIQQYQKDGAKLIEENPNANISIFPVLRLLLPDCDRERKSYNLKQKLLVNIYIRVLCLGKSSKDAQKLINYRIPTSNNSNGSDLAEIVYSIVRKQLSPQKESFTIDRINTFLDDISKASDENKSKDELFKELFRQISALELKWLTRIILKKLKLGIGTQKMLEERFAIKDVGKLFKNKDEYFVQTKFDGERSQIHMKDNIFKFLTRQGFDITNNWGYGKSHSDGFLSSILSRRLNKQCKSIILDGEMMGWHKQRKVFGSKGMSYDVKKLTAKSSFQPCFVAKDLLDIFNKSLVNEEEGIVIKKSDSVYKPNVRNGTGCYKLKAEYSKDLIQDLDLIILGGYYGEGGSINSFMMGVAEESKNEGEEPKQFSSVVSVSSGITMKELNELHKKFEKHWIKDRPNCIIGPKVEPPDLWIRPEHSLILTLRATEITKSDDYSIGYTLRFPRIIKIREDKPWYSACTITEFLSLIKVDKNVKKFHEF
ncbi:PREDICTED: DNA ligase 4-like [Polistes dominula]|uniref:DNA ligase 4-like n=1 Tax=Polistes dominula TaxID=743375 RepID=A0ABM1ICV1_POLDO|nr:PREDICTED: DNA ligase 4-like [Polistes dominula]